jgi:predicted PurR-regulated permease PerM
MLVGSALLVAAVIAPMISELLLAVVLASVLRPVHDWFTKRLGGRSVVSATIVTLSVVLIILGPLAMLIAVIVRDGADGIQFLLNTVHGTQVKDMLGWLPEGPRDSVLGAIDNLPRTVDEVAGQVGAQTKNAGAAVTASVSATGRFLYHGTLMLIALFFTLVQGDQIVTWLDSVSPLSPGQTRELIATSKKVSFSIVVAAIANSAVQAIAALIGFYIAQVPRPIFFASVTFIAAFIPAIGAASVCLVAALLLYATGHPYMAIFLVVWGVLVVGLVDNIIKPLLIRRGMEIHGAVVFFALLGGLAAFGSIGLVVGPLVVSMFLSLLQMYHRDFSPQKQEVPSVPGSGAVPVEAPAPVDAAEPQT